MHLIVTDMARVAGRHARDREMRALFIAQQDAKADTEIALRRQLEMTLSRRLIDDLMDQLGWSHDRYKGFSEMTPEARGRLDADGLRTAYAASRHTNLDAGAIVADDLLAAGCPIEALPRRLAELGGRMTDANTLTLARALLRKGDVEQAYVGMNRVMVEGHVEALGWRGVPLALLRQGEVVAAMTRAYLAAQFKRDPLSAAGDRMDKILREIPVSLSVRRGMFATPRVPRARPPAGGRGGWLRRRWRAWRERAARA